MGYVKVVIIFKGIKYFLEFFCRIQASETLLAWVLIFRFYQNLEVSFFKRLFFRIELIVLIEPVLCNSNLDELSKFMQILNWIDYFHFNIGLSKIFGKD